MKLKKITLFLPLFFLMLNSHAQDLSIHQWQDRLVLVLSKDFNNIQYQKQLEEFQLQAAGMKERRLKVYQVFPDRYCLGWEEAQEWITSPKLYSQFKQSNKPFEVVLIGLDGGVKLHQSGWLSSKNLFAKIDGMPMRRAELRQEANGRQ